MDFIIGNNRHQGMLLPDCIEDYVDENNPVRVIDAYVDTLDFENLGFNKWKPNQTGRPMYSPRDLLKLYIYGYMNHVRSSRRLEIETKRNLPRIIKPLPAFASKIQRHLRMSLKTLYSSVPNGSFTVKNCLRLMAANLKPGIPKTATSPKTN